MGNFSDFKLAVEEQFTKLAESDLFKTEVSKEELWDTYLNSFPEGTNPIFKERTEHDCQCCKQFIRACGSTVAIIDNKLVSIWDIEVDGFYQDVADALSELVKSREIRNTFLHMQNHLGTDNNLQLLEDGKVRQWDHFHFKLPNKFVKRGIDIGSALSVTRSRKDVLKRALNEITLEAIETVIELIDQKSIYRGEENKAVVELLLTHKKAYDLVSEAEKDNYVWRTSLKVGGVSGIRNTAIGTLLVDISEGMELDGAVRKFEAMVAPSNYKRPTALITKGMIDKAQKKVEELGIGDALQRRYARTEDITINNVLFADRSVKKAMNVFEELTEAVVDKVPSLDKVEEVDINTFMESILPKADSVELMFENRHSNNLMSLIAPEEVDAKPIFKWDNNFSWAYNGEVADSMKERVKKAGGDVNGILRFSIQWNDGDDNQNDFDAHCIEPNGNLIHYPSKGQRHPSSGVLDVDIITPGHKVAVENITWNNKSKMLEGEYHFLVHNYSHNGGRTGFTAEIEYDGQIYSYVYNKGLRQDEKVTVAKILFNKKTGIEIVESLPSTQSSKEVWGLATQKFQKVEMVMNSPNYWDGKNTGNKHWFFILQGCKNEKPARGFFNEFLKEDLTEYRKVFEVLGSKMKTQASDEQLSGIGFSSTQHNHVFCRVSGSFNRTIKINL